MATKNAYRENGYNSRSEYLESLADDYGLDVETVEMLADVLGASEDFDGLVAMCEDASMFADF